MYLFWVLFPCEPLCLISSSLCCEANTSKTVCNSGGSQNAPVTLRTVIFSDIHVAGHHVFVELVFLENLTLVCQVFCSHTHRPRGDGLSPIFFDCIWTHSAHITLYYCIMSHVYFFLNLAIAVEVC